MASRRNRNRLWAWWWLRFGFCPCCYSSPPDKACPVCRGDQEYGYAIFMDAKRDLWRARFKQFRADPSRAVPNG